jgi:predicted molibdopterin-dependent oxidoreductase YjgC
MRSLDESELAAMFRQIEKASRPRGREIDIERRRTTFDEIEAGLTKEAALVEARRCLSCGCSKADGCGLRKEATEYGADPYRFSGERRRFSRDLSHPDLVYEPGKCILCEACVKIAAAAGERLGLTIEGRGFGVRVAVPFDRPLSEGLEKVAGECARACPTGALSLRTARACDACRRD